jgi:citrate synthase
LLEADMADTEKQLRREYATAVEAMQILNVRPQTLYAYVSRGWLRSIAQKGLKGKLYLREDLKRLGMRSLARSGHGPVAASAMNWGQPIFPTSITEITLLGPRYRGYSAADLIRDGASFERVAELLWSGTLVSQPSTWPVPKASVELGQLTRTMGRLRAADNILESFALAVLLLGLGRGAARRGGGPAERRKNALCSAGNYPDHGCMLWFRGPRWQLPADAEESFDC